MTLQKQLIPLVFQGINTGKDPKVLSTELLELENGTVDRVGAISKRCGTQTISGSYSHPFMATYEDRAVLLDDGALSVYDPKATPVFTAVGSNNALNDIVHKVWACRKSALYFYPDATILNSNILVICYTSYRNVSGTYKYCPTIETFDLNTGTQIAVLECTNGAHTSKRMAKLALSSAESKAICFFVDASTGGMVYHAVSTTGAIAAVVAISAGQPDVSGTYCQFDAIEMSDTDSNIFVAYCDTNGDVSVLRFRIASISTATIAITGNTCRVGVYRQAADSVILLYELWSDRKLHARGYDHAFSSTMSDVEIETHPGTYAATNMTGIADSASASSIYVTCEAFGYDAVVRSYSLSIAGGTGTPSTNGEYGHRLKLASRPWGTGTSRRYLTHFQAGSNSGGSEIATQSNQSAYFMHNIYGQVVGKSLVGRASPWDPSSEAAVGSVTTAITYGSNILLGVLLTTSEGDNPWRANTFAGMSGGVKKRLYDDIGFCTLEVDDGAPASLRCLEGNGLLLIPSSCPWMFDGKEVTEQGILQYPEGTIVSKGTAGGAVSAGSYGFCSIYERVDRKGNVYRSAPSPMTSITVVANDQITLVVPTLTVTRATNFKVVVYKTEANGAIAYRIAEQDNDTSADSVVFGAWRIHYTTLTGTLAKGDTVTQVSSGATGKVWSIDDSVGVKVLMIYQVAGTFNATNDIEKDGSNKVSGVDAAAVQMSLSTADTDLRNKPYVYTTGGVVENVQPQPHQVQCLHQGRVFYVDREDPQKMVRYSREMIDGDGIGWNDVFAIRAPQEGGNITALCTHRGNLMVFKENHIWMFEGQGETDNGTGQGYGDPILIASGKGCLSQKTLVQIPEGIAFQGNGGLALLDNQIQVHGNFGLPVKYHTDTLTISSATLVPEKEYAIWTTTAGVALVFNYHFGLWSTFTGYPASDACEAQGKLWWHYTTTVKTEDRASFLDGSASVVLKLTTGWIPVSQVQGFGRLYSIMLVGQNIAPHVLNCQPRYDLDPYWDAADKVTFNAGTLGSAFDYGSFLGAGLASTYADKGYELIAGTRRQKMRTVQIRIYDSDVDGSTKTNAGFSITMVALLVGVRDPWLRKATAREMA